MKRLARGLPVSVGIASVVLPVSFRLVAHGRSLQNDSAKDRTRMPVVRQAINTRNGREAEADLLFIAKGAGIDYRERSYNLNARQRSTVLFGVPVVWKQPLLLQSVHSVEVCVPCHHKGQLEAEVIRICFRKCSFNDLVE